MVHVVTLFMKSTLLPFFTRSSHVILSKDILQNDFSYCCVLQVLRYFYEPVGRVKIHKTC